MKEYITLTMIACVMAEGGAFAQQFNSNQPFNSNQGFGAPTNAHAFHESSFVTKPTWMLEEMREVSPNIAVGTGASTHGMVFYNNKPGTTSILSHGYTVPTLHKAPDGSTLVLKSVAAEGETSLDPDGVQVKLGISPEGKELYAVYSRPPQGTKGRVVYMNPKSE